MDIGVIGWWDYDNQGDLAMLAALRQGLAPHRVVPIATDFEFHPDVVYRLNRLDFVLFGGGTLIPGKPTAPFDTFDRWADQLACPLGAVGLGVDPIKEQYWPATQALLDRSEFFYVRDRASRALLHDHPKVQVRPDLTFAYPLPNRESGPSTVGAVPVCGVNLRCAPGFDPSPWCAALSGLPVRIRGVPLSSFDVFNEGALLRQLDADTPDRFDAAIYQQLDLMVGTAFHSILFAVQAGVPVIAIAYAPKVRNFMEDAGLARYLLAPHEHHKLAGLVAEVLADHSAIRSELGTLRARLQREAERNLSVVRERVEHIGVRHQRTGPRVSILVKSSGDVEKDRRTLASCAEQTYGDTEILIVEVDPQTGAVARFQQALAQSSDAYVTCVDGGDRLAHDALDCLSSYLDRERGCDVVYADYYAMDEGQLPRGRHTVPDPSKLYRRDVVGPCFVARRRAFEAAGSLPADSPLPMYTLWLQMGAPDRFRPFHAPLMYSARQIRSGTIVRSERVARRIWRKDRPVWSRALWRFVDSDLGERFLVQPLARLLRLFRRAAYAEQR